MHEALDSPVRKEGRKRRMEEGENSTCIWEGGWRGGGESEREREGGKEKERGAGRKSGGRNFPRQTESKGSSSSYKNC